MLCYSGPYGLLRRSIFLVFFLDEPATPGIYTLSLHDALPIFARGDRAAPGRRRVGERAAQDRAVGLEREDRKSTRLNSSHSSISYAVFCLKKKRELLREHSRQERRLSGRRELQAPLQPRGART